MLTGREAIVGTMPDTLEPMDPAVSRTCSTTRLITLGFDPARVVLVRRADALRAGLRFALARLVVRRFAAAFFPPRRAAARDGARRREDFFGLRERFDEDRFLEEDRFLAAMGFLLFMNVQSGLM